MRGPMITLGMIGCLWLSSGPGARGSDAGDEPAMNEVVFREGDEVTAGRDLASEISELRTAVEELARRLDRVEARLAERPGS